VSSAAQIRPKSLNLFQHAAAAGAEPLQGVATTPRAARLFLTPLPGENAAA
jgi:hypothetical protein